MRPCHVPLDIEPWEPEESVGKLWHAFASRWLSAGTMEPVLILRDWREALRPVPRLGGNPSVEMKPIDRKHPGHRPGFLQQLGSAQEEARVPVSMARRCVCLLPCRVSVPRTECHALPLARGLFGARWRTGRRKKIRCARSRGHRGRPTHGLATLPDAPGFWQLTMRILPKNSALATGLPEFPLRKPV